MIKVFYRCVDSNLSWWTVGKEYPLIDGRIQCDDPDIGPTERRIADLCCEEMKASGAAIELTRIERETFEAAGLQWFRHTPGDPMPCAADARIYFLTKYDDIHETARGAGNLCWGFDSCIIGWRYYDAETSAPEPELTLQKAEGEIWNGEPTTAYIAEPLSQSEFRRLYFGDFTPPTPILGQADGFVDHGPEEFTKPAPIERRYGRDANEEMQQADLAAMDPGHLTPSQRRHIDEMEEKQAAKENLQRDAEADKQREHSKAMADAANAMERVKQDHGHRLGWKHDPKQ